jgi:hypothetical protein
MEINDYFGIRTEDIHLDKPNTPESSAYHFFFKFLQLSPSYELARKASKGKLSHREKRKLPSDFKKVQENYEILGNVQNTFFRYWWQKNGFENFGMQYEYPSVDLISVINELELDPKKIKIDIKNYLNSASKKEVIMPSILLSIPLDKDLNKRLKSVKEILVQHKNLRIEETGNIKPKIELYGKRINRVALMVGHGLLLFKVGLPNLENWRLGVLAQISLSYSPALDFNAPRQTQNSREAEDRVLMGKITQRSLLKYQKIAENAARGKFPCDEEVEMANFDYKEIYRIYKKTQLWEKRELLRLQMSK